MRDGVEKVAVQTQINMQNKPVPSSIGARVKLEQLVQAGAHGSVFKAYLDQDRAPSAFPECLAVKTTFGHNVDSRRETVAMNILGGNPHRHVLQPVFPPEINAYNVVLQFLPWCHHDGFYCIQTRPSQRRAKTNAYQLLTAVRHCHRLGIVHRDIKPENVLMYVDPATGRTYLKLADFGACYHRGLKPRACTFKPIAEEGCGLASPMELTPSPTYVSQPPAAITPLASALPLPPIAAVPRLKLEQASCKPYAAVLLPGDNSGNPGTLAYMAPEYLHMQSEREEGHSDDDSDDAQRLREKLDAWSAGVTIYAMTYGMLPPCSQQDDYRDSFALWEAAYRKRDVVALKRLLVSEMPCQRNAGACFAGNCSCNTMPDDAAGFFIALLDPNPATRCTVEEALHHEWLAFTKK